MSNLKRYQRGFIASGSVLTILFLIVVNLLTTEKYLWFIYPVVLLLLLPLGLYCIYGKKNILFQVVSSFSILALLILENIIKTPDYPWVLYAALPIILWPILSILGKRNQNISIASTISILFILYYTLLNIFLAPSNPWAIFPAFAISWWPLTIYHIERKSYFAYSVSATLFISLFFISINVFYSPNTIWAVYPIFAVLWWPLSMYYFHYRRAGS